jgi:two-component system, sensor histidine kinase RegB
VVVVDEEGPAGRASRSRPRRSQLVITIDDRGSGMTAEVLSRIGEPFFTTKSPGRGMGLGMFLSRAVVEGVGGTLQIDSVAGRGTTAQVTLPLSPAVPDESSSRSAASQLHARSPAADAS